MKRPMFSYLLIITQCCCFLKVATGQTCSPFCMSCIGDGSCESCYQGYYGDSCTRCPSENCVNNTCDMKSGICSYGCKVGYFQKDTFCYLCDTSCKSCNNASQCLECKTGYYGSRCQYGCNLCKGGECTKEGCTDGCRDGYFVIQAGTPCEPCNKTCTRCSSYTECSLCKDGYYGQACQFPCQSLSKINGSCLTMTPDLTSQSTQPYNTRSVRPSTPTTSKVTTTKPSTSAPSSTPTNSAPSSTPTNSEPSSTPRNSAPSSTSTNSAPSSTPPSSTPTNSAPSSTPTPSAPSSTSTTSKIYLGVGILVVLVIAAIVVVVVIRRRNKKERIYRLQASRASHDQTGMLMTENAAYVSADECLSDRPVVGIGGNNCSDIMTLDAVYSMPTKTAHVPITSQDSEPTSKTNEITFQTTAPPIPVKSEGYLEDETSRAPAKKTTDNELNYSSISHL